ncbi:hypothetical protein OVA24_08085 [Luteolibacter sp. SL250]|uniref:hypothetical protein n=1 Tax=Luteolibacter sp. SL250 TaxID=2995170 RepID=UPI00226E447F|nr:hypothetical protein [Luteolibacter sp. SL250]WAC21343.1 hypothetical protein OVA24_08085 [Luteolibacter sp. SL250]
MVDFPDREPCPWLPQVVSRLGPEITRRLEGKKEDFYLAALGYSQSLWLEGKPAQAILQLNKAWMADLHGGEDILTRRPSPYRALRWIMERAQGGAAGFMGNPVRHFQHLASRMSGPRAEIRVLRAWACFHLASSVLDPANYPRDGVQIAREGLWIPGRERVFNGIRRFGWKNEIIQLNLAFNRIF